MKTIPVREFRNQSASVLDAVERGESFVITRNGMAVAQLRPVRPLRAAVTAEVVEAARHLPVVRLDDLRAEADAFFGDDDRL